MLRPQPCRFPWVFPQAEPLVLSCLFLWVVAVTQGLDAPQAAAQEPRQACLLSVEKTAQAHLIEPRYSSLSFAPEPSARMRQRDGAEPDRNALDVPAAPLDIPRTRLTLAWGYYNQGDYEKAVGLFEALAQQETAADVAEESRLGLAYALLRLHRLPEAAHLLEELVSQGIRHQETVPALVETLLALKRYEDAEKYLPLLP
jgi:tetratricopeptide (TPR) repeat protein